MDFDKTIEKIILYGGVWGLELDPDPAVGSERVIIAIDLESLAYCASDEGASTLRELMGELNALTTIVSQRIKTLDNLNAMVREGTMFVSRDEETNKIIYSVTKP